MARNMALDTLATLRRRGFACSDRQLVNIPNQTLQIARGHSNSGIEIAVHKGQNKA